MKLIKQGVFVMLGLIILSLSGLPSCEELSLDQSQFEVVEF